MIFFQLLLFFISIFFFSLSISGYGKLINLKIKKNFFLEIFLGIVILTFVITFIHFFFKISLILSLSIFGLGLIFFLKKKDFKFSDLFKINNIYLLVIIIFFIPMFLSQKYHEDFGYYHLPYALGFIEEKIVFGYANIDKTYVYNSIWLNLYSIFFLDDKNYNFLTLPSYLLFLAFILFSLNQIISNKNLLISDYYLLVVLFYFILKFTRISEFGVDLPAVIFSILGIYYFINFHETDLFEDKQAYFFLILVFSVFSILIKLSTLPIILLPFYLYLKNFKELKFSIFRLKYLFIYFLFLSFFIQQFIYSGCFLFPTNLTCLDVSWFNKEYLNLTKKLELINKGYYLVAKDSFTPEEYLSNLNWLYFWFKRNAVQILEHFSTIIIPTLLFILFSKNKDQPSYFFKEKVSLSIILFFGLIFWLHFSPVYRFAIHLFVTLIFILFSKYLLSKIFSKVLFMTLVSIFIFFSFSKNIIRLNKVDNIYLGIQNVHNKYLSNKIDSNEFAKVFYPDIENNTENSWQGRLCWNTPFICSYNKLEIKKNKSYLILKKK